MFSLDIDRPRRARGQLTDHLRYSAYLQVRKQWVRPLKWPLEWSALLIGQSCSLGDSWLSARQQKLSQSAQAPYKESHDGWHSMPSGPQSPRPVAGWWLASQRLSCAAPLLTLTASLVGSSKYYSCKGRSHNGNSACHQPGQTDSSTGVYIRVLDKFKGKMGSERASSPRGTSRQRCEWTLRV